MYVHIMTQNKSYTKSKIGNLLASFSSSAGSVSLVWWCSREWGYCTEEAPTVKLFVHFEIESPFSPEVTDFEVRPRGVRLD